MSVQIIDVNMNQVADLIRARRPELGNIR